MLSKKDYEQIAEILRQIKDADYIIDKKDVIATLVVKLGSYFALDNSKFDWNKWKKAIFEESKGILDLDKINYAESNITNLMQSLIDFRQKWRKKKCI